MLRPQLHVLTDETLYPGRTHADIARAAFAGGADVVQLRDKRRTAAELVPVARELAALARRCGGILVVNDHFGVALGADAEGLHLGPDDLAVADARPRWPRPKILGGSARTLERARALERAGCDYLGVGPVYGTKTKSGAPQAIGLDRIAEIAAVVGIPVIGIGGIDASNAADVVRAGALGIAVVSWVAGAPDPEGATRALRRAIDAL
jgi:thiamine-phosphate diphosphorylase